MNKSNKNKVHNLDESDNLEIKTESENRNITCSQTVLNEDRIILNVGGIKYETYRSTLTAYPETLLGIMFAERNKEMLHPTNGNEYFFDRDGHLFRYILQYYRTGKIHWPESIQQNQSINNNHNDMYDNYEFINELYYNNTNFRFTNEVMMNNNSYNNNNSNNNNGFTFSNNSITPISRPELEIELQYFLITPTTLNDNNQVSINELSPSSSTSQLYEQQINNNDSSNNNKQELTFANKVVTQNINGFVRTLKEVLKQVAGLFEKNIIIVFYHNRQVPTCNLSSTTHSIVKNETAPFHNMIKNILIPYSGVGYTILMNFEEEIQFYLKREIPELTWLMKKPTDLPNRFVLHLALNDRFLKQLIIKNSCLSSINTK